MVTMSSHTTSITAAASVAIGAGLIYWYCCSYLAEDKTSSRSRPGPPNASCAYETLIGNTPMMELQHLSKLLQRRIFVKLEHLNPGGTGKDRAARSMILAAERAGDLPMQHSNANGTSSALASSIRNVPRDCDQIDGNESKRERIDTASSNVASITMDERIDAAIRTTMTSTCSPSVHRGMVVEGTSGSTGIALATLARCRGHACVVVLPDDQAAEKRLVLQALGAVVLVVPTHSISHPHHYVNVARRLAERARVQYKIQAVFMDQFDNLANYRVHYDETGPEVWEQCQGDLQAICLSAGTGGTIAGVGLHLKQVCPTCQVVLVDPPGSSLYHKVVHGVCYAPQQAEQTIQRHRYDTLAEGIGLDRITYNLQAGLESIDTAIQVSDQEALDMAHWLMQVEGLWVGSSSAMNVVGAVRTATDLPKGSKIVTFICDSGQRHVTRFWNRDFVMSRGLRWPGDVSASERLPECLQDALASR